MNLVKTSKELGEILAPIRSASSLIGFVPTMGALHNGHISLIKKALSENEVVICSIFVNPTQFNDPSDLEKYPKPIEKDIELLTKAGCHYLFLPEASDIYADGAEWSHSFGKLEQLWEGAMRPGHFKGVGQVVYKLFNLVLPNHAYFGQKDYQQTLIIQKLIDDFKLPIQLHVCPVVREENGLAMSSRNMRLPAQVRLSAGRIFQTLQFSKELVNTGEKDIQKIIAVARLKLEELSGSQIEYIAIVEPISLEAFEQLPENGPILMIIAIKVAGTRLIDNMFLRS